MVCGIASEPNASQKAKQSVTEEIKEPELAKEEETINPPLKFSLKLDPDHPYFTERGLDRETVEYFGLGYCSRGLMKGRIAIPIHDDKGELVAYPGRLPGDPPEEEGKYKVPPGFQKHLVLFNFHRAVEETKEEKLIVVEGFFDCFRIWQAGFKNTMALMEPTLSPEQEDLLTAHAKMILLMLDQDDASRKATQEILCRLAKRLFIRIVELASEKDQPDRLKEEDLVNLLRDICSVRGHQIGVLFLLLEVEEYGFESKD